MKCSDLMVACREAEGIEYNIGVAGEESVDFMMSLQESACIRFMLSREEPGGNGHTCDDSSAPQGTSERAFATQGPSLRVLAIDYRGNAVLTERLGHIPVSL